MRDKKPRFHFESTATPTPAAAAAPAASTASTAPAAPADLQALFVQGRAESPLIAPVDQPLTPPFVTTNTDYVNPPAFTDIHETDLGKLYVTTPVKDKRALGKVARIGGFGSPEAMARAFGYPSVDQMIARWEQTISSAPRFQPNNFGTNNPRNLPYDN
jgi:hypothetical protein